MGAGEGGGQKNVKNYPHGLLMAPYSDGKIRENEVVITYDFYFFYFIFVKHPIYTYLPN